MLENSFVHLPGIGPGTEEKLWAQGLHHWDHLSGRLGEFFGPKRADQLARALDEARAAADAGEYNYFQGRFKGAEMWRLFPLLASRHARQIAYLDIETTGLGFPPQCRSTTIAVYFDGRLHVEHDHARKLELLKDIDANAKLLVTYNGGTFDLPFLRREFALPFAQAHLDLRFWFARLGFKGGLKGIQKAFPAVHQRDSMDIDGFDAVRLWALHKKGVPNALETLKAYNAEDTVVLEALAHQGVELERGRRPQLPWAALECPQPPVIPFAVCPHIYRMLRL